MYTAQSISPYGHDLRMLESLQAPMNVHRHQPATSGMSSHHFSRRVSPPLRNSLSPLNLPISYFTSTGTAPCHLLRLPPELLDQILAYVLPYTTRTSKGIAWVRRSVAVLATCHALHAAASRQLYGANTFVLRTSFAGTNWHLTWTQPISDKWQRCSAMARGLLARTTHSTPGAVRGRLDRENLFDGTRYPYSLPAAALLDYEANAASVEDGGAVMVPSRDMTFPQAIAERYRHLLRNIAVAVQVEDAYAGEIKYGYGGPGLADGVRNQVAALVEELTKADDLLLLIVRLAGLGIGNANEEARILEPLAKLKVGRLVVEGGWPA